MYWLNQLINFYSMCLLTHEINRIYLVMYFTKLLYYIDNYFKVLVYNELYIVDTFIFNI